MNKDVCIHTHTHIYIHTMEYYSAIKKNTFESLVVRWMNLEPVIQSEVNQRKTTIVSVQSLSHV